MTRLVDTTLRLLSQEPLARTLSTRDACCASPRSSTRSATARSRSRAAAASRPPSSAAVESPWERIRALAARTRTPLAMALRGTFLVGGRPADADLVRRFILCAAESGIDIFRLHDPLNDVDDLAVPGRGRARGRARGCTRASSTRDGPERRRATCSSTRAACPTSAPTACCCTTPRARSTRPPRAS